jgi:fructose/tagatose bisphosphate aldolase
MCEKYDATLESEIGHVPGLEADYCSESFDDFSIYTDIEEAKLFVEETGVDALAVSVGTAHGMYKEEPQLSIKRLQELREALDVPLVLHGASGLSHDALKSCVKNGISKINIFTDLAIAAANCLTKEAQNETDYMKKSLEVASSIANIAEALITVCGSSGKA